MRITIDALQTLRSTIRESNGLTDVKVFHEVRDARDDLEIPSWHVAFPPMTGAL